MEGCLLAGSQGIVAVGIKIAVLVPETWGASVVVFPRTCLPQIQHQTVAWGGLGGAGVFSRLGRLNVSCCLLRKLSRREVVTAGPLGPHPRPPSRLWVSSQHLSGPVPHQAVVRCGASVFTLLLAVWQGGSFCQCRALSALIVGNLSIL